MAKTKTRQQTPDETVKYLVKCQGQADFVIEIPATWRVTFASVNPANNNPHGRDGYCLRVYEGEKLRAVWGSVIGLRDMSIPFARKIERETGSASWEKDSEGNFKRSDEVHVDHQLVADNAETPF